MRPDTRQKLSDPELTAIRDRHMRRLRAVFDGEDSEETAFVLCGMATGFGPAAFVPGRDDPGAYFGRALDELAAHADALRDQRVFRPLAVEMSIHGVHFIDSLFDADVFDLQGSWQARTLASPVGSLARPALDDKATWRIA